MKRIISIFIPVFVSACMLAALLSVPAAAQTISMEAQNLTYAYPDSWLVVSPQLALVYTPLLE